jgi:hypothetical protein
MRKGERQTHRPPLLVVLALVAERLFFLANGKGLVRILLAEPLVSDGSNNAAFAGITGPDT